jgi:hypothetical protein
LKPLFERAKKMAQGLESFIIEHVYREQNREADELVNQALDETGRGGGAASAARGTEPAKENPVRLKARCRSGQLELQEPLGLPDGTEVELLLRVRK